MVAYTKLQQGKKEKAKGVEERGIRSSLLILDFHHGRLYDSGKEEEGKTFRNLHALGTNNDLWDRVRGLGGEAWQGFELIINLGLSFSFSTPYTCHES